MSDTTSQTATKRAGAHYTAPPTIHRVEADGVRVFYRAAGDATAPVVLLLHGFPASSFMFRELIPRLATDYRVIAPDLPGFGFTEVSARMCVHVHKHHLLVDCGDTIRALSGAKRQSGSNDHENWRDQPTGECPHRAHSSSPEYRGQANGQVNRISFLTSKTAASVRPSRPSAML
jgi:pimeloyl-ACP methyl ester carboxylesterase